MSSSFGPGVSRTLSPLARAFQTVVFQRGKPPLDGDLNLSEQISSEETRKAIQAAMPSGFLTDPTRSDAVYHTDKQLSNCFYFNPASDSQGEPACFANVNGWLVQVAGSNLLHGDNTNNLVKLYPAPSGSGSARTDFVFLEVWQALVRPNPSTANKPDATHIWKYGNVQHNGTNILDDLQDPTLGFETSKRVQLQYRIRVYGSGNNAAQGVDLTTYPDGLDDPHLLGQGTSTGPVGGFAFSNMGELLGDPSLWRAGDGNPNNALGTIDGYVYAIPMCAVFRRNTAVFVAANSAGNPNQNGSMDRTPNTVFLPDPLTGATVLTTCTLNSDLTASYTGVIAVQGLLGSGLEDLLHYAAGGSVFVHIGSEILEVNAPDTVGNTLTILSRGRFGTHATYHNSGVTSAPIQFYNVRPDGLFADEIARQDILDCRRAIVSGEWDYTRLLTHNVGKLLQGGLHSTWKVSANGQTQGASLTEVDYMIANSAPVPNLTIPVDGPDGIRTVFSDAAVIQRGVSLLLDPAANLSNGFTSTTFDTTTVWDVGAGFYPQGFINWGRDIAYQNAWSTGSSIFLYLEGPGAGNNGARASFQSPNTHSVRALTPREYWKEFRQDLTNSGVLPQQNQEDQYPFKMRALGTAGSAAEKFALSQQPLTRYSVGQDALKHPGSLYPDAGLNFEYPFIVLGDILNSTFATSILANSTTLDSSRYAAEGVVEIDLGLNFDAAGTYWTTTNNEFDLLPNAGLAQSFLYGQRTFYSMLTADGTDSTGQSSDVYLVLWGDDSIGARNNNGAFKIVGAGTITNKPGHNLTTWNASTGTRVVAIPLNTEFYLNGGFNTTTGNAIHVQARSQVTTTEGGGGVTNQASAVCVVLTDVLGSLGHPWNRTRLGYMTFSGIDVATDNSSGIALIHSPLEVNLTLQYSPSRGFTSRVAEDISRFAVRNPDATYLRQAPGTLDPAFPLLTGAPANESFYDAASVPVWNHLGQLGWEAGRGLLDTYGGKVISNTEQDREHELLVDPASKTAVFRPFRHRLMTLQAMTIEHQANYCLLGNYSYPTALLKDGLNLFTQTGSFQPWSAGASPGKNMGFSVPAEYMPKFGRQDIPYYKDTTNGAGLFLEGVNHLFVDSTSATNPSFTILGGHNMGAGGGVSSLYFRTNNSVAYGASGTNIDGAALNRPFYEARKSTDIIDATVKAKFTAVVSSDLGAGLEGIQLPPYLGIARIYGVYEYTDYISPPGGGAAGVTYQTNRASYDAASTITNLLRKDAIQQTLFIMQDGAIDLEGVQGAHTYIVPSNVIDITKIPGYAPGAQFKDYNYVVECVVFGFAKGWIDGNNYVLCRQRDAQGIQHVDGANPTLASVKMCIPAPAHLGVNAYTVYSRTPYQGDPYGTKGIASPDNSDFVSRYGGATLGQLAEVNQPMLQFENGVFVPQAPNPRSFEVLASLDFYTTMGTGKVGGELKPGTFLDSGYLAPEAATRLPASSSDYRFHTILPCTFTEGQKEERNQAGLNLIVVPDISVLNAEVGYHDNTQITLRDIAGQTRILKGRVGPRDLRDWLQSATNNAGNTDIVTLQEHGFTDGDTITFVGTGTALDGTQIVGSSAADARKFTISGVGVTLTTPFKGQLVIPEQTNALTGARYFNVALDTHTLTGSFDYSFPGLVAGATTTAIGYVAGAQIGDIVLVDVYPPAPVIGIPSISTDATIRASVTLTNKVTVYISNTTAGNFGIADVTLRVSVLRRTLNIDATAASLASVIGTTSTLLNNVPQMIAASDASGKVQLTANQAGRVGNQNYIRIDAGFLGFGVTSIVNGATTEILTTVDHNLQSGQMVYLTGFTGAGAANINNRFWKISTPIGTSFFIAYDSTLLADQFTATTNSIVHPTPWEPLRLFRLESPQQEQALAVSGKFPKNRTLFLSAAHFVGGEDAFVNAGNGTSAATLTGMTERLPLGILCQDSDFLSENVLNDQASAVQSFFASQRPLQATLPLTTQGKEYTKAFNVPGDLLGLYDGSVLQYTTYDPTTAPAGTRTYRVYRGGSTMVLNNPIPGAPLDWTTTAFPPAIKPILKGGLLACRALLVRNYQETAFAGHQVVSYGDEIQMVVLTQGIFGTPEARNNGLTLQGEISPSGYGEGYAAADRYRLEGKPMFRDFSRLVPNAIVQPAPHMK